MIIIIIITLNPGPPAQPTEPTDRSVVICIWKRNGAEDHVNQQNP